MNKTLNILKEIIVEIFITTPKVLYGLYITKKYYKIKVCGGSPMSIYTKYTKDDKCMAWKCGGVMGNWDFTFIYSKDKKE